MQQQAPEEPKAKKRLSGFNKKDKIEALVFLQRNNFNIKKTAEYAGVSIHTIRSWVKKHGSAVFDSLPEKKEEKKNRDKIQHFVNQAEVAIDELAILRAARKLQMNEGDLINTVYIARFEILDKLVTLVKESKSVRDVAYALEVLQKAEAVYMDKEINSEFTKRKEQFLDMVKAQHKGFESTTLEADFEIINNDTD